MYIIRKNSNGGITIFSGRKIGGIIFIIFPILRSIGYILSEVNFSDQSALLKGLQLLPVLFSVPFIIVGIQLYKSVTKFDKAKNLKKNGRGILKRVRITSIEHYESSGNDDNKGFSGYYVEARDGDIIYCSDVYQKGHKGGSSIFTLKELYRFYGYEYDEKETHKQDVLKEYDKYVKKCEAENAGFSKRLSDKGGLLKGQREMIEKGYEPPYREVDGRRITVGDTVDVYIDIEDEKIYRMDIDFLFEK